MMESSAAHWCNLIADSLRKAHWQLATAESCTGGLIAAACTDLAGSSHWFERGFVTYSNQAKCEMLGVDAALLERYGAVSEEVARAMAQGALAHAHAQVALAVTGVAGPSGGTLAKPVGTVWFAWAVPHYCSSEVMQFTGDRATVRTRTMLHSLEKLYVFIDECLTTDKRRPPHAP